MGLFDWLKGPKTTAQTDDLIWLTRKAKFAAVQRDVADALADPDGPDAIFVVAHFQDCLDEIQSLAADAAWDQDRVFVTCSDALERQAGEVSADDSLRILIIVAERHPLTSHDDALREFAQSLFLSVPFCAACFPGGSAAAAVCRRVGRAGAAATGHAGR